MFDLFRSACHTLSDLFVYATVNQRESVFGMLRNCVGFCSSEARSAEKKKRSLFLLRNDLVAPTVIEPAARPSATGFPLV